MASLLISHEDLSLPRTLVKHVEPLGLVPIKGRGKYFAIGTRISQLALAAEWGGADHEGWVFFFVLD